MRRVLLAVAALLAVALVFSEVKSARARSSDRVGDGFDTETGEAGGRIVAQGTPEDTAHVPEISPATISPPLLGVPRAKAS